MRIFLVTLTVTLLSCSGKVPAPDQNQDCSGAPNSTAKEETNMLHPDFPVIEGEYRLTEDWSITLPDKFNRRFEDNALVIWRPGLTIWTIVWNNDHNESKESRLVSAKEGMSPDSFGQEESSDGDVLRFAYRLKEESDDDRVAAFYGFAIGDHGQVQLAIYFDDEGDLPMARALWRSLEECPAETP